jgi:hypothetical protein
MNGRQIHEMCLAVERFILEKKNRKVKIDLNSVMFDSRQLSMLIHAYNVTQQNENNNG